MDGDKKIDNQQRSPADYQQMRCQADNQPALKGSVSLDAPRGIYSASVQVRDIPTVAAIALGGGVGVGIGYAAKKAKEKN